MLEKVQADRQVKLEQIRALGIDPYGARHDANEPIRSILARCKDDAEGRTADAAGRLILLRNMGRLVFAHLRDQTAQMQVAFRKNALDETAWRLVGLLDIGDIVAVAGAVRKTKTGEITIWAEKLTLLCKSLNPMPEKFHGLKDVETRYRQRYLDLMANPETLGVFQQRAAVIEHIRQRLNTRGFMEVETPVLQAIYGGAAARPFTTHHNSLDRDLFLRISPELHLKRLLVGGMERVYEFSRNFRNEGIDATHNPEFTMLELYQAYADYEVMMEITEELISTAAETIIGSTTLPYGDVRIDYTRPWRRARYADLLAEHAGVSITDARGVRQKARTMGIDEAGMDDAVVINEVFGITVERHLVQPTFVMDYPAALCPLTRRKSGEPETALRFECFIAHMEIANAYTELNDPADQQARFEEQLRMGTDEVREIDTDFVTALKHGMPPAGGLGIGIDRLVMILTNSPSIRDVLLFPLLRPLAPEP